MATLIQLCINFSPFSTTNNAYKNLTCSNPLGTSKIKSFDQNRLKLFVYKETWGYLRVRKCKDWVFVRDGEWKRKKRVVLVRFNDGSGFTAGGGGGGGGGRDNSGTARLLGNIALAVGLTYLSLTGQLGGVLDATGWVFYALISIWLLAVFVPVVGLGAFLWWAGRDIVQSTFPNCGNEFQIFKSTLNDELQLCPFCSQPFSVVDNKFVKENVKFSNDSTPFGQAFRDFTSGPKKEILPPRNALKYLLFAEQEKISLRQSLMLKLKLRMQIEACCVRTLLGVLINAANRVFFS